MRTTAARAAALIRRELKEAFPQTKFRVVSKNYTGGSSIRASWVDGPTESAVKRIIGKYEMGRFDGMIDMYEYTNVRDDIPQVSYVFANRHMSDETELLLRRKGYGQSHDPYTLYRAFNDRTLAELNDLPSVAS